MKDDLYKIALSLIPKVGAITARRLVAYAGSAEALFAKPKSELLKIPGLGALIANRIANGSVLKEAEQELLYMDNNGISFTYFLDETYPLRLRQCEDAPVVVYYKGAFREFSRVVSVVGTRKPSEAGKRLCEKLIADLADRIDDIQFVSGLAYGIDITTHKAAIEKQINNIAVLGHGLNLIYPASHKKTAAKILENGALFTEFSSKKKMDPGNFISRNRIIAGLADVTIVVESATKGGALITADVAFSYNRDVAAFPGRVGDVCSAGCNNLIKVNKAALIESADDVIKMMRWDTTEKEKVVQKQLFQELTDKEENLIRFLSNDTPVSLDEIAHKSQLSLSVLKGDLLALEFKGLIKSLPGNAFLLNS